ncbi:MAG TPA: hypothetical protein VMH87_10100 [Pseudomonadales bacterium]|nr:hypothetical protein [Pseudomonadales bacterium]
MTRIFILTLSLLLLGLGCSTSQSHSSSTPVNQPELRTPPNTSTVYRSVPQLLQVYEQLSSVRTQADDNVYESTVMLKIPPYPAMTRSQAIKFIEKILRDQAGIIATHPKPDVVVFKLKKHHQ